MMERGKASGEGMNDGGSQQREGETPRGDDLHHFPSKLHRMLVEIDSYDELKTIVSWRPHGRAFRIEDENQFIEKVMPIWFRVIKFNSFRRQLHLFGFRKIGRKGPDKGSYHHEMFVRGSPELATHMKPIPRGQGKRGRKPRSEEPDHDFLARDVPTFSQGETGDEKMPLNWYESAQEETASKPTTDIEAPLRSAPAGPALYGNQPFSSVRPELREIDPAAGNPQYQHSHDIPARPVSMRHPGMGLPLPSSMIPHRNAAATADLEPFPVNMNRALENATGCSFPIQMEEYGMIQPQRNDHFQGYVRPQHASHIQQQQQELWQLEQQIEQQRLMLHSMTAAQTATRPQYTSADWQGYQMRCNQPPQVGNFTNSYSNLQQEASGYAGPWEQHQQRERESSQSLPEGGCEQQQQLHLQRSEDTHPNPPYQTWHPQP